VSFSDVLAFTIALSDVRLSEGGDQLSYPTARFCAELILSIPMRDPHLESAIELAKRLGTYNKADRSAQYRDASLPALLRSHNKQWAAFREQRDALKLKLWIMGGALVASWGVLLVLFEKVLGKL
jgi:hypothetical protein